MIITLSSQENPSSEPESLSPPPEPPSPSPSPSPPSPTPPPPPPSPLPLCRTAFTFTIPPSPPLLPTPFHGLYFHQLFPTDHLPTPTYPFLTLSKTSLKILLRTEGSSFCAQKDLEQILLSHFKEGVTTEEEVFDVWCREEEEVGGEVVSRRKGVEVRRVGIGEMGDMHARLQALLWFWIETASFVEGDGWSYFLVYEMERGERRLAGYVTVEEYEEEREKKVLISQVLVLPPYQRKGYGRRLVEAIYSYYDVQQGFKEINVEKPTNRFKVLYKSVENSLITEKGYYKLLDEFTDYKDLTSAVSDSEWVSDLIYTNLKISKERARVYVRTYLKNNLTHLRKNEKEDDKCYTNKSGITKFGSPPKLRERRPKRNCAISGSFIDFSDSEFRGEERQYIPKFLTDWKVTDPIILNLFTKTDPLEFENESKRQDPPNPPKKPKILKQSDLYLCTINSTNLSENSTSTAPNSGEAPKPPKPPKISLKSSQNPPKSPSLLPPEDPFPQIHLESTNLLDPFKSFDEVKDPSAKNPRKRRKPTKILRFKKVFKITKVRRDFSKRREFKSSFKGENKLNKGWKIFNIERVGRKNKC